MTGPLQISAPIAPELEAQLYMRIAFYLNMQPQLDHEPTFLPPSDGRLPGAYMQRSHWQSCEDLVVSYWQRRFRTCVSSRL